jgi:hypothetical protein
MASGYQSPANVRSCFRACFDVASLDLPRPHPAPPAAQKIIAILLTIGTSRFILKQFREHFLIVRGAWLDA